MSEVAAIAVPASIQTLFFMKMGSKGAAIATIIAKWISCIISIFMFIFTCHKQDTGHLLIYILNLKK